MSSTSVLRLLLFELLVLEGDSAGRAHGFGGSGMLAVGIGVTLADVGRLGIIGVYLADQFWVELLGGVRGCGIALLTIRGIGSGSSEKSRRSRSSTAEVSGRAGSGEGSVDGILAARIGRRARLVSFLIPAGHHDRSVGQVSAREEVYSLW